MNDCHWKKHCCTQTNGDDEDNAPPAPEDKNRLKVKINQSINQPIYCKLKHMKKQHPHSISTHSAYFPTCYLTSYLPFCNPPNEQASLQALARVNALTCGCLTLMCHCLLLWAAVVTSAISFPSWSHPFSEGGVQLLYTTAPWETPSSNLWSTH